MSSIFYSGSCVDAGADAASRAPGTEPGVTSDIGLRRDRRRADVEERLPIPGDRNQIADGADQPGKSEQQGGHDGRYGEELPRVQGCDRSQRAISLDCSHGTPLHAVSPGASRTSCRACRSDSQPAYRFGSPSLRGPLAGLPAPQTAALPLGARPERATSTRTRRSVRRRRSSRRSGSCRTPRGRAGRRD
jgi:hypothetical protein